MSKKQVDRIRVYFGGWYQRTTLHLTELYRFLKSGESNLSLSKEKLTELRDKMGLVEVSREVGYLEYIKALTDEGIEIRYYEDGLYVLYLDGVNVEEARQKLESFYEEEFAPAVAYIFSLGAPTPKVLANIKTVHPLAVASVKKEELEIDEEVYGKIYSSIEVEDIDVKKTPRFIFLAAKESYWEAIDGLVEMQIFFREFKDQLQKYLDIHRHLWEEISEIKERKVIKGKEVENVRMQLDAYQKTINLIGSRINQMGSYVHTRAEIAREMKLTDYLSDIFQYKFEVLNNTHGYIKEIWTMTTNYLNNAIQVINEIKDRATNKSIQSLQIITTYGVVGGIIGYLSRDSLPKITGSGLIYFGLLVVATWLVNKLVSGAYGRGKYHLKFAERVEDI